MLARTPSRARDTGCPMLGLEPHLELGIQTKHDNSNSVANMYYC